jgi:hypothetical protein
MAESLRASSLQAHWDEVARFYPEGFRRLIMELCPPRRPQPFEAAEPGKES